MTEMGWETEGWSLKVGENKQGLKRLSEMVGSLEVCVCVYVWVYRVSGRPG